MKKTRLYTLVILAALAGCQSAPITNTSSAPNDSWNGMHLDPVQFLAEEKGFTCLAPSGMDFTSTGQVFKKTLCFKTEKCETIARIIYLDAHSMLVTSMQENRTSQIGQCESHANSLEHSSAGFDDKPSIK